MRIRGRFSNYFSAGILILSALCLAGAGLAGCDDRESSTESITILQTSDMHNHASGYGPLNDYTPEDTRDNDMVLGGYARLATKINQIRKEQKSPVLLFDSGDFFMGTSYDLASTSPISMKYLQEMKYDAVTLGNHEFDWGPAGLALLLGNGRNMGFDVPIVATSMVTNPLSTADDGLEALVAADAIVSKKIIETKNGLKIGVLGLVGPDAIQDMPAAAPVTFDTDYDFIQEKVDDLRNNDNVDLVVVLSHGGVELDETGDDADLAKNVTGIDVIASGHYHTADPEAVMAGGTIITSPGNYGQWLGRLDLKYNKNSRKIIASSYELIPIDDTIPGDPAVQALVEDSQTEVSTVLALFGLPGVSDTVGSLSFPMVLEPFTETGLGNMAADALRFAANQTSPADPFDVGVVANGVIRDFLYAGKTGTITFSDAYNVLPLGISPATGTPGYPLMSAYINGQELRTMCEISATFSRMLGDSFYLNVSGIRYEINPAAAPGALVQRVFLVPVNDFETLLAGTPVNITDTATLYHVVTDYYILQMMSVAANMGISIIPKDVNGTPIPPASYLNYRIDRDPLTAGIQELNSWIAMLGYFQYFDQVHGGSVPESIYSAGGTGMGRVGTLMP